MRRDLRHYELPSRFAQHYRPVRVHSHEKGLASFTLDEYGLRFFRIMATGSRVPAQAVWSIISAAAHTNAIQLVAGCREDSLGFVVCEVPHGAADPAAYPVLRRLSYRARVTIAALQSLLADLADHPAASPADVVGVIERRIEQLRL